MDSDLLQVFDFYFENLTFRIFTSSNLPDIQSGNCYSFCFKPFFPTFAPYLSFGKHWFLLAFCLISNVVTIEVRSHPILLQNFRQKIDVDPHNPQVYIDVHLD